MEAFQYPTRWAAAEETRQRLFFMPLTPDKGAVFPWPQGRTAPPPIFFLQKKTGRGRSKRKLFNRQGQFLPFSQVFSGFRPPGYGAVLFPRFKRAAAVGVGARDPAPHWETLPGSGAGVGGRRDWRKRRVSVSGNQRRGDSTTCAASSAQAADRLFPPCGENALPPLRFLSPQNLRFCGGPVKGRFS